MLSKVLPRVIILAMIVCLPQVARASFFDDSAGQWWMNAGQWEDFHESDPLNQVSLKDQNDRLEFSFTGNAPGDYNSHFGGFLSKWSLSLTQDFDMTVGFHHDNSGIKTDTRDIGIVLCHFVQVSGINVPTVGEQLYAESDSDQSRTYSYSFGGDWEYLPRSSDDGVIEAHYDATLDKLQMSAKESDGTEVTIPDRDGLRTQLGVDSLSVVLGGVAEGVSFTGEHTYLQDFQLTAGTPTAPEPVSAALFLFGGGALGLARARKKSKRKSK